MDFKRTFARICSAVITLSCVNFSQPVEARPPMTVANFIATHARLSHSKDEINIGGADFYAGLLLKSIYGVGYKAMRATEEAKKQCHPLFCLPQGSKGFGLNIEELHSFFDTIPPEQRGMFTDEAMLLFVEHKFPCATGLTQTKP